MTDAPLPGAAFSGDERFTEFHLNQACAYLQVRMANTKYASDLDLYDRFQTRLHLYSQLESQNPLPANLAGDFQLQPTEGRAGKSACARMLVACVLRKKINVKRVNC